MTENKEKNIQSTLSSSRSEGNNLKEQFNYLQAIFDTSPELIAATDKEYRFIALNKAYRQAFAATYGIIPEKGMRLQEALAGQPVQLQQTLQQLQKALEVEAFNQIAPSHASPSNLYEESFSAILSEEGETLGVMYKGREVQTKHLEEKAGPLAEFTLLADAMPQIVWTALPTGELDFINNWASRYMGASKKELLEGKWLHYIHPEDITEYKAKLQVFFDSKEGFELEYRLRGTNGSYRWHLGKGIPVWDKEQTLIQFIGTATDIHEHKSLLNQYELKAKELEQTMEAIPQMVWITEADGNAIYFNRQWYQFTGSTPKKSLQDAWLSFLHPEDINRTKSVWNHSLETGKDYHIEYRLRRSDGKYHWFIGKGVPLRNSKGDIVRWFGTCSDIHDQKKQRDELDHKNQKLYQINRYLDDFVHAVAHDLRSPVAGLKLSFELLHQVDESKQEKILKGCQTYLERLDNTLKGLVQLIEVQEEGQAQHYDAIDIHQVIDEVVKDLQYKLMDAGASVKYKRFEWRTIVYPKPYIYNILRNILRYALRFRDTQIPLNLTISSRQCEDDLMLIEIKDNGPGINLEKEIKHLFKPFSHINKGSDQQGMGLAIVKHMLEKNGGRIEVKSTLGKGTKFRLYLKEYSNTL